MDIDLRLVWLGLLTVASVSQVGINNNLESDYKETHRLLFAAENRAVDMQNFYEKSNLMAYNRYFDRVAALEAKASTASGLSYVDVNGLVHDCVVGPGINSFDCPFRKEVGK